MAKKYLTALCLLEVVEEVDEPPRNPVEAPIFTKVVTVPVAVGKKHIPGTQSKQGWDLHNPKSWVFPLKDDFNPDDVKDGLINIGYDGREIIASTMPDSIQLPSSRVVPIAWETDPTKTDFGKPTRYQIQLFNSQ